MRPEQSVRLASPAQSRSVALELTRVAAFLMVFLGHLMGTPAVRPLVGRSLFLFVYGHQAVIAFFILSGLVNRISLDRKPVEACPLLYSRMKRLLPIYILVVLSVFAMEYWVTDSTPLKALLGHLVFVSSLQGEIVGPLDSNAPLWSMSFEFWFYVLLAICVSTKANRSFVIWSMLAVAAIPVSVYVWPSGVFAWIVKLFGYSAVWLLGYFSPDIAKHLSFSTCSIAMLIGAIPAMTNLGVPAEQPLWFLVYGLLLLPLFLRLCHEPTPSITAVPQFLSNALAVAATGIIVWLLFMSQQPMHRTVPLAICPFVLYLFSQVGAHLFSRVCSLYSHEIVGCARLTYALYLVHAPLIWLGVRYYWSPAVMCTIVVGGSLLLAIFLERAIQPVFNSLLPLTLPNGRGARER